MKKLFVALALLLVSPVSASAQWAVYDAANHVENTWTKIETVLQRMMQVVQLKTQLDEYFNNFEALKDSIGDDIVADLHALFDEVGQIQGMIQDLGSLDQQFEELYPNYHHEIYKDIRDLHEMANQWIEHSKETMRGAARVAGQVVAAMENDKNEIDQTVARSQVALGNKQLAQAGNQLLGQIASSMVDLKAQMATAYEAQMTFYVQNLQMQSRSDSISKTLLRSDEQTSRPFKLQGSNYVGR